MSHVLPNAMVGRAFEALGVENQTLLADGSAELAEVLPAMVVREYLITGTPKPPDSGSQAKVGDLS